MGNEQYDLPWLLDRWQGKLHDMCACEPGEHHCIPGLTVDALRTRCEELEGEVTKRGAIIREALGWISQPRDRMSPRVALLQRMRECALLSPAPAPEPAQEREKGGA